MKKKDFNLINLDKVDSTSKRLKYLIKKNNKIDNVCVSSNFQTDGYGRRKTKWISYNGNLHLSILIKPFCNIKVVNQLSFISAISMGELIKQNTKKKVNYKWPNDILINKKKVSGIIIETSSKDKKIDWVIVGIGLNIIKSPKLKKNLIQATSLKNEKIFLSKDIVLKSFLKIFFKNYYYWKRNGFQSFKKKWISNLYMNDNKLLFKINNKDVICNFLDLLDDGSMKVEINTKIKKIFYGAQLI